MMNKKGISAVVANVLIILLVVAGVVLLWTAVRPTIEEASEQIGADCLTVDLEVDSCGISEDNIHIRRNSGSGDLGAVRILINGEVDSDCTTVKDMTELDSVGCSVGEAGACSDDESACWIDSECSAPATCDGADGTDLVEGSEVQLAVITGDGTVCNPLRGEYVC